MPYLYPPLMQRPPLRAPLSPCQYPVAHALSTENKNADCDL